jgi:predicted ABC-type ATPase
VKLFEFDPDLHPRDSEGKFKDVPDKPTLDFLDEYPPKKGKSAWEHLGNNKDTQQLYSFYSKPDKRYVYVRGRQSVHEGIKADALEGAQPQEQPTAIFLAGGPGSGKTTSLEFIPGVPDNYVNLDADKFKEGIPEYQGMIEDGDRYAAAGVHEESIDLLRDIQHDAMEQKYNLVIDGTGNGPAGETVGKLKRLEEAGYKVRVVLVDAPVDVAQARSLKRAEDTGRFVPLKTVRQLHRSVWRRFPEVWSSVQEVDVYDGSHYPPRLVVSKRGEQIDVEDAVTMREMLEKADAQI